ncbi:hypothetical protein [Streptomyces sp. NPDC048057]|uniref:hypothetical protein n=1 Tax=Streptomyces sp. NPDC048057 TaxID=3155628 RepID=UPI0033E0A702
MGISETAQTSPVPESTGHAPQGARPRGAAQDGRVGRTDSSSGGSDDAGGQGQRGGSTSSSWWRVPLLATAVVVPLYVLWAGWLATGGGDLAAQLAWKGFTEQHPGAAYNLSWYGGTHTANYSLLAPPLMALMGVKAVSVASGLGATWALALLCVRSGLRRPVWPALAGALALWANVASGRTTFALGTAIGLVALVALARVERRTAGAATLAALCAALSTAASPVAGLFLVVVGAAWLLDRQWWKAVVLLVPPALVVGATTLLFPFKGEMPMQSGKLWMSLFVSAVVVLAAPPLREWRLVRYAAGVYALGVVLTYFTPSPIGRNVERLTGLAGPPVLLAAVLTSGALVWGALRARSRRSSGAEAAPVAASGAETGPVAGPEAGAKPGAGAGVGAWLLVGVLTVALAVNTSWLIDKTEDDLVVSNTVPAWAQHTDGVVAELQRLGADRTRVEAVPARNHREATLLAPHVNLARGWNRQLDVERGRLFYDGSLSPETYRAWLDRWAVGFVVLHHGRPDGPAEEEAALVRSGPEYLKRVWKDKHWTIYRVKDAVPLVEAPAQVVSLDPAELVIRMSQPGSVTIRVAHSPWLRAEGACLEPAGEFTRLTVKEAGEYRLDSAYRLSRGAGAGC